MADQSADRTQTQDGSGNSPPPARRRTGRPAPSGRPAAGSISDLLARLDRLPDGHPSSPYEDGGLAKPLPHRLRQLELGLPAPERDPVESGLLADFGSPAIERTSPVVASVGSATDDESQTAETHDVTYGAALDSAPGPETGVRPEPRADPRPVGDPAVHIVRARCHRAIGRAVTRAGMDSPSPPRQANGHGGADHHRPAADALSLGPWAGAEPEASAPAERRNGSDSRAPRAPSGWSDDQADLIAGMLAAYRTAEGRSPRGEYGESGLTPAMRRIAAQLPRGGLAPGTEALKSPERLAAKLARLVARHPGCSPEELAAGIGDGIRYTFTFDPDYYTEGTWLVHRKLKAYGFELEARRNRWDSPEYKGVWTRWRDPAHGLPFEVQFHTGVSWDIVQRTHEAFVRITDPAASAADRARLRSRQVAAAAVAKAPPGYAEISDFGREAR